MALFKRPEASPNPQDVLRFDEQQLAHINGQLERLTSRAQPDTSPRRVGLFHLLRFEGDYYDRSRDWGGVDTRRVQVWLGSVTNPVTRQTQPYNVAIIDNVGEGTDSRLILNLDTGSYDYDIDGLHISQLTRYAVQELGPDARSHMDFSEDHVYRSFFYSLGDAGSQMYRDTAAPK